MSVPLRAFLILAVSILVAQTTVAEPKRVALVIGNSRYDAGPLVNPSNDADSISDVLTALGVTVTKKKDVTKPQMEAAVDAVTSNLQRGDMCLIFYAGHGMQMEKQNYLVPLKAQLDRPQHVKQRCVTVSYLLDALRFSECSLKVVVIDACRNNPFRSLTRTRSGLLKLDGAPEGTIVSFSTSPRTTALDGQGSNSPFAKHLTNVMRTKGDTLEIVRLFREASRAVKQETGQVPYLEFDATMPDYFLNSGRPMNSKPSVPALRDDITNSIGMQLTLIPAGEFMMGSGISTEEVARRFAKWEAKAEYYTDEHPQHRVKISKPFYMGVHEVTRGQFRRFVTATGHKTEAETDGEGGYGWNEADGKSEGRDPKYTWRETGFQQTDAHPVVNVTWNDAVAFCRWLSSENGVQYRLPTEAEWEYACRAGTNTLYSNGNDPEGLAKVGNVMDGSAKTKMTKYQNQPLFIDGRDGFAFTAPVGQFPVNAFGLHDMHGNVYEWCSDWYGEDYYANSPDTDPRGPSSGSFRVLRGGSWFSRPYYVRSSYRSRNPADFRSFSYGFRVVRLSE